MIKRILIAGLFIFVAVFTASILETSRDASVARIIYEAVDNLTHPEFYLALANPKIAYVKVTEGMRKEQIADMMEKRFDWDLKDTSNFYSYDELREKKLEGKYFPDIYLVSKDISGQDFKKLMFDRFDAKTKNIKTKISKGKINMDTALTIASIIQREAAGKKDMNLISGIIWNRLFNGMSLQMDATVQYAKGSEENGWWPKVTGKDISIESPYNTYQIKGLPPSPISNPGIAAIDAALSPQKTNCMFYIHKSGQIYCSKTYEDHKKNIAKYLL
jgi:UPF0755 protein